MNPASTLDELGPCQDLVIHLREANLLKLSDLESVKKYLKTKPKSKPDALAQHLVSQGVLTPFQADYAVKGLASELTLFTYILLEPLNIHGRVSLFKVRNKADNLEYCLKILPRRNSLNLPKIARQLKPFHEFKHDSVVPIIHIGASGDRQYLVWPFQSEGETLTALVRKKERLSVEETLRFALPSAEGLAVCHKHGMIHGLLKPSNFVVTPRGKVHMLGFGLGFLLTMSRDQSLIDTMNTQQQLAGCVDCGAPESLLDPTDRKPAGDQYSFGCVLYYCLTGRFPFVDGTDIQKVMAHQSKEPPSPRSLNPDIPVWLEKTIQRLMSKPPDDRFASMNEVMDVLRAKKERSVAIRRSAIRPIPAAKPTSKPKTPALPEKKMPAADGPPPWMGVAAFVLLLGLVLSALAIWWFVMRA